MTESHEGLEGAALERLLDEHLPGLRAYVRLKAGPVVRRRESVSDVVQSTCREVLVRAGTFQHGGEAGFKRWLYSTALRKILNKHEFHTAGKRDARRDADNDVQLLGAYDAFCSPSRLASAREELDRIEGAFEHLTADHREVILLSRVVGLSRAEVACEMDRTEASVRNLLNRALVHLAERLEER